MKKIIFLLFIVFPVFGFTQSLKKIDSLKTVLSKFKDSDRENIPVLTDIINEYMFLNKDSTLHYSNKLFRYAKKYQSDYAFYFANYSKAFYYYTTSSLDSVIYSLKGSIVFAKKIDSISLETEIHLKLGAIYNIVPEREKAKTHIEQAIKLAKEIKNWDKLGHAYLDLGHYYQVFEDNERAIKAFQSVDSIYTVNNINNILLGNALLSIGVMEMDSDNLKAAAKYFDKSNQVFESLNYINGKERTNIRLSELALKNKNFKKSIQYAIQAEKYFKEISDIRNASNSIAILGEAYIKDKQDSIGISKLNEALKMNEKLKSISGIYFVKEKLSEAYYNKKDYKKSIKLAKEVINYIEQINIIKGYESYLILSKSYSSINDYPKAYKNLYTYQKIHDSVNKLNNFNKTQELESQYQSEKNEQEIALLKTQRDLTILKNKNKQRLMYVGLILLSIFAISFYFLYRNRKKLSEKLHELDLAKSTFFTNISHEFRTPLTLISGVTQKLLKKETINKETRTDYSTIQKNSKRLLVLVDQLLDISKIEAKSLKLHISKSEILPFIGALIEGFSFRAQQKNIEFVYNISTTKEETWFDKDVVTKIVVNLVSNAVKYTPENEKIICDVSIESNKLYFEIKNSGAFLSKSEIDSIFDRFYQVNESASGTGVGLALVRELVTLHKGTIDVTSNLNDWTSFRVILPVAKSVFNEKEIDISIKSNFKEEVSQGELINEQDSHTIIDEANDFNEKPILLLVDDNEDVRRFVGSLFNHNYQIITASNGYEGIEKAIKYIPDLIISDLMMPVTNGIELCNTLKVDERTSHIPIIILTAKKGEQNTIEGIKTGADDYITKPFNNELLVLRVEKLIENVKKLQKRYSQEVILKPMDISINSIEEQFLEKLQQVIDNKIIESDFSSTDFSSSLGMSRMQLHRKIKALFGMTTTEFIRSQRLKLAADLLITSDCDIAQIAYKVGFNDPTYFSKCFKELYKCTPSDYIKANR